MSNETNKNENENVRSDSDPDNSGTDGQNTEHWDSQRIDVSAMSPLLAIPRENIGVDAEIGEDVNFGDSAPAVRKPDEYEKFCPRPELVLTTRLLVQRQGIGGIDVKYYHVIQELRGPIFRSMKSCVVLPWFSIRDRRHNLWIVKYHPGSSWFDSIECLTKTTPEEFFVGKCFTVESNRDRGALRPLSARSQR